MTIPDWLDQNAYPFTPRSLRLPDGTLSYLDEGSGPAVLFAHGTPTWSFEWRHLVRALAPRHRCVAPDHLGFGLSERPRGADYRPEAHARRFAAFCESLDLENVTLVVHDYGGPIALPWALERSRRIRQLIVLNSWMWSFADDALMRKRGAIAGSWIMRLLYRWANASLRLLTPSAYGDRRKLTAAIHRQYLEPFRQRWARSEVLWALAKAINGSSAHYQALWEHRSALVDIPTLVIWGMRDSAFQPYLLARWREAAPHARVLELAKAGHWPHEEEPAEVSACIRDFIS